MKKLWTWRARGKARPGAPPQPPRTEQGGALAAEKDKLRAVLDSIPDGIMLLDEKGAVLDANAGMRAILGVSADGRPPAGMEGMPDDPPVKALLDAAGGEEKTIRGKTYRLIRAPVLGSGLGPLYEVCLLRDVTLEHTLAQKKSDLVSMITHDVKSPLTAIIGISQWISAEGGAGQIGGEAKAGLETIGRAAGRILTLMDNFLFLSSIEGGRGLEKRPVDLNAFVNKALLEFYFQAKQKGISLNHSMAEPPPVVHMDEHQMMRALANLVNNALKYTPEGGQVSVFAENLKTHVTITVMDSGHGINKKDIPLIFDRYYRSETARKGTKGSGLGLAIAKAVVESHGGAIDVTSEEGKGSRFTLRLPAGNDNHNHSEHSAAPDP